MKDGALKVAEESPTNMGLVLSKKGLDPKMKNSVKGKKALARIRYIQSGISDEVRLAEKKNPPASQGRNGDQNPKDSPITLLTSKSWTDMEFQFRGEGSSTTRNLPSRDPYRDEEELNPSCGLGMEENLERIKCLQGQSSHPCRNQSGWLRGSCNGC